jgi:hypothetical protein
MLSIALVAVIGIPALMSTWNSASMTMTATAGDSAGISLFSDCMATVPLTAKAWGALSQNTVYETPVYVYNSGNQAVQLYMFAYPTGTNAWIPTVVGGVYPGSCTIFFNNQQVQFDMAAQVISGPGMPCELGDINYQGGALIPCKFVGTDFHVNTDSGFLLMAGKMVKLDVTLCTHSLVNGASYAWTLTFDGLTVG